MIILIFVPPTAIYTVVFCTVIYNEVEVIYELLFTRVLFFASLSSDFLYVHWFFYHIKVIWSDVTGHRF